MYTNEDNYKLMFLCGMMSCIFVLLGLWMSSTELSADGIYINPESQTVLIAGEACTINMTESMNIVDFTIASNWCWTTHEDFFKGE